MASRLKAERYLTPEEYLAIEREAEEKSEYIDGRMYLRQGASEDHNIVEGNLIAALHSLLRGRPCRVYPGDMRVRVMTAGPYVYPDVVVVSSQ